MTTRFRIYVQAAGPQFRHIVKEELHSLLSSASPTVKPPSFSDVGTTGIEFNATLRDIYVLSHGLRSADDMLVQLSKKNRVVSLSKFTQLLQSIPFHAFGQRFSPFIGRKGFKSLAQKQEDEKRRAYAERFTLPENIRLLVDKSKLSPDRTALKYISQEAIRRILTRPIKSENKLVRPGPKKATSKDITNVLPIKASNNQLSTTVMPPRPCPDPVVSGLTINLQKNRMTVSISSAGQRTNMLFKRGWRNKIIETSLRESIAAAVLHTAYTEMSPMKPDSPLTKLNDPQFTRPIANALNTLANSITSLPPGFKITDELRQQQLIAESVANENIAKKKLEMEAALKNKSMEKEEEVRAEVEEVDEEEEEDYNLVIADPDVAVLQDKGAIDSADELVGLDKIISSDDETSDNDINATGVADNTFSKKSRSTSKSLDTPKLKTKKEIIAEQLALRTPQLHSRDSTSLSDVVAYTISSGITRSDPSIRIFDPFCGSGTIVIEGAHKFLGLPPPALPRSFAFENWPIHNEPEYNSLIKEWNTTYDEIIKSYKSTFGTNAKRNNITGEEDITLSNFPLFIGSDLRDKSIRAAVGNAKSAKVDCFTQFFQGDFEKVMNYAGTSWNQYLLNKQRATDPMAAAAAALHASTNLSSLPGMNVVEDAVLLDKNGLPMNYFDERNHAKNTLASQKSNIITFDQLFKPTKVVATNQAKDLEVADTSSKYPIQFPYLKGYTLFSNIPWGVSDAKAVISPEDRTEFNRGFVNTTQMETMDSLYLRLGRSLYHNAHLFRDVYILSAHAKFEKLTMIGAERAERDAAKSYKDPRAAENAIMISHGYTKPASTMRWKKVETFYNQGVKTHLLKLEL